MVKLVVKVDELKSCLLQQYLVVRREMVIFLFDAIIMLAEIVVAAALSLYTPLVSLAAGLAVVETVLRRNSRNASVNTVVLKTITRKSG